MSLAIYTSAAWTANGGLQVADNATIEVRRESDGALATIYSDRAGEEPITNPSAFGDASGRFQFFAADGEYRVKVSQDGNEYTLRYQSVGDVSRHATETGGIHGIPEGEQALHTADLGPAPSEVPTNQQLADGVERDDYMSFYDKPVHIGAGNDYLILLCELQSSSQFVQGSIKGARSADSGAANAGQSDFVIGVSDNEVKIRSVTGWVTNSNHHQGANLATFDYDGKSWVGLLLERASSGSRNWNEYLSLSAVHSSGVGEQAFTNIEKGDATNVSQMSQPDDSLYFGRPGDSIQGQSLYIAGDIGDTVEVMIDGDGNVVEA